MDLATQLVRLARLVQDVFAGAAADHGLTATQARMLCVLAEGPRGMGELAGALGVEKAAATGIVDRIERRGLAERIPVPGDRRACRVRLTPRGGQEAHSVHADICRNVDLLTGSLSATRKRQLSEAILQITGPRFPPLES